MPGRFGNWPFDAAMKRARATEPFSWDIVGTAAGPAKDSNFNVIFYDRMLQQDGAGASMGPPYRFIVFTTVVKPKEASVGPVW
jgi:hypothetical protein